jgi:hypothetical protein
MEVNSNYKNHKGSQNIKLSVMQNYVNVYLSNFIQSLTCHFHYSNPCFFVLQLSLFLTHMIVRQSYWPNLGYSSTSLRDSGMGIQSVTQVSSTELPLSL